MSSCSIMHRTHEYHIGAFCQLLLLLLSISIQNVYSSRIYTNNDVESTMKGTRPTMKKHAHQHKAKSMNEDDFFPNRLSPNRSSDAAAPSSYLTGDQDEDYYLVEDARIEELEQRLEEECGLYSSTGPLLSNGRETRPGEFPSYVYVEQVDFANSRVNYCGGTILDRTHILTAAHCYNKGLDVSSVTVTPFYSVIKPPLPSQRVGVKKVCMHHDSERADLVVYELSEPIIFNKYVQSACLPLRPVVRNQLVWQLGRGMLNIYTKRQPDTLLMWPVKETTCPYAYNYNTICFNHWSDEYKGTACPGDSGSGAIVIQDGKMRVVGVESMAPIMECHEHGQGYAISANTLIYKRDILKLMLKCTSS